MQMAGSERSAHYIQSILKKNANIRSGIIGVNIDVDVVFENLFDTQLDLIPTQQWIADARVSNADGILAFDTILDDTFVSRSAILAKLKSGCEAANIELVDVMLFGTRDWISLRRQNRI